MIISFSQSSVAVVPIIAKPAKPLRTSPPITYILHTDDQKEGGDHLVTKTRWGLLPRTGEISRCAGENRYSYAEHLAPSATNC